MNLLGYKWSLFSFTFRLHSSRKDICSDKYNSLNIIPLAVSLFVWTAHLYNFF